MQQAELASPKDCWQALSLESQPTSHSPIHRVLIPSEDFKQQLKMFAYRLKPLYGAQTKHSKPTVRNYLCTDASLLY